MWLRLTFDGAPPADLAEVLGAFDPSFGAGRSDGRYRATSPVTAAVGKHGARPYTEDTNAALRARVRRLDADLLTPLRAGHRLTRVEIGPAGSR